MSRMKDSEADTAVWLVLDNHQPNRVYTNGDVLRGQAFFHPSSANTPIKSFNVNFTGAVETNLGSNRNNHRALYHVTTHLFTLTLPLLVNGTVSSTQCLPFEFPIPWNSLPHSSNKLFPPHPSFTVGPNHPLPPSFSQRIDDHWETFYENITYSLEAVADVRGQRHANFLNVRFCPSRTLQEVPPAPVPRSINLSHASRALDPSIPTPGFRQRTKSLFASSSAANKPVVHFSVSAVAPSVAVVGDALPVELELMYEEERSTAPERPDVMLVGVKAALMARTDYRIVTDSPYAAPVFSREWDGVISEVDERSITLVSWGGKGLGKNEGSEKIKDIVLPWSRRGKGVGGEKPTAEDSRVKLNEIDEGFALGHDVVPTFQSPSISRCYLLVISVDFLIAGKKLEVEIANHGFVVLPKGWREYGSVVPPPPGVVSQDHMHI